MTQCCIILETNLGMIFFFLNCELANLLIELLVNFVDFVYFLTFEVVYIVLIVSPCLL